MNKKGFTLVEIILALAIMALLLVIVVPGVFVLLEKNKEKSCNSLINNIESAAKIYVVNNKYELNFECTTTKNITFQTLIDSNDLKLGDNKELINPIDDKKIPFTNTVSVTYDCTSKKFTYKVNGISCTK